MSTKNFAVKRERVFGVSHESQTAVESSSSLYPSSTEIRSFAVRRERGVFGCSDNDVHQEREEKSVEVPVVEIKPQPSQSHHVAHGIFGDSAPSVVEIYQPKVVEVAPQVQPEPVVVIQTVPVSVETRRVSAEKPKPIVRTRTAKKSTGLNLDE